MRTVASPAGVAKRRFPLAISARFAWAKLSIAGIVLASVGGTLPAGEEGLRGFSPAATLAQRSLERRIRAGLSAARIEAHLRWLTRRAHPAGSEGARLTAEYLQRELESYGFATETVRYDAYLPAPVSVSLELLEPVRGKLPTTEERIEADPFTHGADRHPGWAGYSPSGDARGQVVYAHFGAEKDLESLEALGVDLEGKVLLMRHFGVDTGRKVANAQRFGAAAAVLYADPAEDGYRFGDVYPHGNWRPAGSIMRRSLIFLPYSGDPLSPGWASKPGARRLLPREVAMPGIPSLPISYGTAERILRLLEGPVAPAPWQGALPLTYHVGPGPARLRVRTEMDHRDRPIWNVVGRLEGAEDADQWVIVGNHHDAWIYGGGDPSSGTAALLELARVLGQLSRQGVRPRRTLIVAFWDAEEMLLGGSTEWVEDRADELLEKAVACINMDSAVFNPERAPSVSAHSTLHRLFREVAREVPDPRSGRSTFDVWRELQNRYRMVPSVDGFGEFFDPERELHEPWIVETPYDDAAPFFYYLALPASDMYYGADYGMYHSLYENFHWMKTVVDPTFAYHVVMAQMQGFVALRLANADLLPLDYAEEARWWRRAYLQLAEVAAARGQQVPSLDEALRRIDAWEAAAEAIERRAASLVADGGRLRAGRHRLSELNRLLYRASRDFLRPEGRPGMPTDRNLFAGESHDFEGVSGSTLPGIRFSLDRDRPAEAEREAELHLAALGRRLQSLRSILDALEALQR
jgi:N-acetylated-alpha-linked acidic dipeptidase